MDELPRSLDPLPGESLPGYLLRLAYRLSLTPAYLARRVGLNPTSNIQRDKQMMVALDPPAAAAFARATRLSIDEVTALTLAAWRWHYPPVAASIRPNRTDQWLFTSTSRYCPRCLAGDGSQLQRQLGGAWQKSWRLPIVFICPEHQIFLRHQCPGCRQPANHVPGSGTRLLTCATDSSLHPAQCRTSLHRPGVPRHSAWARRAALASLGLGMTAGACGRSCPTTSWASAGSRNGPPVSGSDLDREGREVLGGTGAHGMPCVGRC